jgi:hypothetical protein
MTYSQKKPKEKYENFCFFNTAAEAHLSGGRKLSVVHLGPKGND